MDTPAEITLFIALTTGALVAGGQLFCRLAVIPAFTDWTPDFGVSVHQHALTERPHRYLRVVSAVSIFSAAATVALEHSADAPVLLTAAGLVLGIGNGVFSQREWPINDEINEFGDSRTEEQVTRYKELRKKWDEQHTVRTVMSMTALACFAAAAVVA
jgi:hypothetical protein